MANVLILSSATTNAVAAIAASRGANVANLLSHSPKEVWADNAVGSAATIDIDLGAVKAINTVALCAIYGAAAGAVWTISGGAAGYAEVTLKASTALRAVDAAGQAPSVTHALWTGATSNVRYVRISVTQPAGEAALRIGRVLLGSCFQPTWNMEWGAGRGVTDTGSATRLPDGGIAVVEGARFGTFAFSLGDLTDAETEALYALLKDVGETLPVLVVEDPAGTTAQANRIHYGKFVSNRRTERREAGLTRQELTVEEWI